MLSREQFDEIAEFVRHYLNDTVKDSDLDWVRSFTRAADHRWQHTLNVLHNANKVLEGERATEEIGEVVRVAALLHDVSLFTCSPEVHGQKSAEIAEQYLQNHGYPNDLIKRVVKAVVEHGVDFDEYSPDQMGEMFSIEGKFLIEADLLDKLGAAVVSNAILMMGRKGLLPHEVLIELPEGMAMRRAVYFKRYIWSNTAKGIAEKRFAFFQQYLEQLSQEIAAEDVVIGPIRK